MAMARTKQERMHNTEKKAKKRMWFVGKYFWYPTDPYLESHYVKDGGTKQARLWQSGRYRKKHPFGSPKLHHKPQSGKDTRARRHRSHSIKENREPKKMQKHIECKLLGDEIVCEPIQEPIDLDEQPNKVDWGEIDGEGNRGSWKYKELYGIPKNPNPLRDIYWESRIESNYEPILIPTRDGWGVEYIHEDDIESMCERYDGLLFALKSNPAEVYSGLGENGWELYPEDEALLDWGKKNC